MRVAMLVLNDMRGDARVTREASALAEAGHEVVVLALRNLELPDEQDCDGYRIRRVADYSGASWRQPLRKMRELRARTRSLGEAAAGLAPEVVHANDSDTLEAAVFAVKRTGAGLLYDAHELFPDMLLEHGLQGSPPVQAYWKRIERRYVPEADAVVTVSDGLAAELHRRFAVDPVVVMNVPPLQPLLDTARLRSELGVDDAMPVVLYQGVLTPGRGLVTLVEAVASLPDVVLAVQGAGPEEARMRSRASELGVEERVRLMGHMPPSSLHEYACGADAGVVIYEPTTLNNRLAAPNKLFAYLMAGLPVAGSDFPGLASIVEGERVGRLFDPTDAGSIARALGGLLRDPARPDLAARARHLAETRYNWDREKCRLLEVYERLEASRGGRLR